MAIHPLVVVLLCVLGAGAVVVAISAFGRQFIWKKEVDEPTEEWNQISPEQGQYMKRVRDSIYMDIVAQVRHDRSSMRQSGTTGTWGHQDGASTYNYPYGHGHGHGHAGGASGRGSSNGLYRSVSYSGGHERNSATYNNGHNYEQQRYSGHDQINAV